MNYTVREPQGVAGLISPWNLPLYLLTFKLAPAVMCGNTVVAKPSEMTSITAYLFCKVLQDAGNVYDNRLKSKNFVNSFSVWLYSVQSKCVKGKVWLLYVK